MVEYIFSFSTVTVSCREIVLLATHFKYWFYEIVGCVELCINLNNAESEEGTEFWLMFDDRWCSITVYFFMIKPKLVPDEIVGGGECCINLDNRGGVGGIEF